MTIEGPVRHDHFRPRSEPARTIYDAIKQNQRDPVNSAWAAARDYAKENGLPVLKMKQIMKAEWAGLGHVDYSAKFAYRVRDLLLAKASTEGSP